MFSKRSLLTTPTGVNSEGRCITDGEDCFSLWRLVMERLSEPERAEIWDRGEAGESQRSICRVLGRSPSTIWDVFR